MGVIQYLTPILLLLIVVSNPTNAGGKKVVCYYPNWPYYRPGAGQYQVSDIQPDLCTHIIYSFMVLDNTTHTVRSNDPDLDIEKGNLRTFTKIRDNHPGVKLLLALGGWTDSRIPGLYSTLLASPTKRSQFVEHTVQFLEEWQMDGLDLDYEYPVDVGGVQTDREGFTALVRELREAFNPRGWELTSAVSASTAKVDKGYQVPELSSLLDAVHLMTYDLHGSWEPQVAHHAPLYGEQGDLLTVHQAVQHWLNSGCPREKLVVGIPTYGRTWTLNSSSTSVGAPAQGGGTPGDLTGEAGFLAYAEICQALKEGNWTQVKDPSGSSGPYAYSSDQWVGYDDPSMARIKANYILAQHLGGAMFWDLASDDFSNMCGSGTYPIIRAVSNILRPKESPVPILDTELDNSLSPGTPNTGYLWLLTAPVNYIYRQVANYN